MGFAKPKAKGKKDKTEANEVRTHIGHILVKNGADVNAKSKSGATPLLIAVKEGNLQFAKFLLENGTSVSGSDEKTGANVFRSTFILLFFNTRRYSMNYQIV